MFALVALGVPVTESGVTTTAFTSFTVLDPLFETVKLALLLLVAAFFPVCRPAPLATTPL
jgi:hypothetical protein